MVTDMIRIPKLAETADGKLVVTHWGHVASILFRVGDRLILSSLEKGGLIVMTPRGWGNPMFGRRSQGHLIAEPSGNPANPCRWSVAGAVVAIERDLERGGIGPGRWFCAVRVESVDLAAMAGAADAFKSGWKTAAEVDALCRRAAVAPETHGVNVAVACGDTEEQAEALLGRTTQGRLRFTSRPDATVNSDTGIVLPGPWQSVRDAARSWDDSEDNVRQPVRRRAVAAGGSRVQLSLFGDSASVDG